MGAAFPEFLAGLLNETSAGRDATSPPGDVRIKDRLTSLQLLNLLLFLEEDLGVPIREEDLVSSNFDSIPAIEALVERYRDELARCASATG